MNHWPHLPDRDQVLEKVYNFFKLLSEQKPDEAEKLVRVGNMDKFRDTLHYYLADYALMIYDDETFQKLPDDLSLVIDDPYTQEENELAPNFTGTAFVTVPNERVEIRASMNGEITPIWIQFMIYEMEGKFYLNLMQVRRE